jgi:hypothetical protein
MAGCNVSRGLEDHSITVCVVQLVQLWSNCTVSFGAGLPDPGAGLRAGIGAEAHTFVPQSTTLLFSFFIYLAWYISHNRDIWWKQTGYHKEMISDRTCGSMILLGQTLNQGPLH